MRALSWEDRFFLRGIPCLRLNTSNQRRAKQSAHPASSDILHQHSIVVFSVELTKQRDRPSGETQSPKPVVQYRTLRRSDANDDSPQQVLTFAFCEAPGEWSTFGDFTSVPQSPTLLVDERWP